MKKKWQLFFSLTAFIWTMIFLVAAATGTIGGIADNIQYKDWFSVTMWAIFGPIGIAGGGAVIVMLLPYIKERL
jgi:hypothetical protein